MKSLPIPQNGTPQGCSISSAESIQKAPNIAATLVAVPTCAKVWDSMKCAGINIQIDILSGEELDAFLSRKGLEFEHIAYVGDGSNDFCPILRLRR